MPLLVYLPKLNTPNTSPQAFLNSDWDAFLAEVRSLYPEELKHLHNAETRPQALLSLCFHCRMDVSVKI